EVHVAQLDSRHFEGGFLRDRRAGDESIERVAAGMTLPHAQDVDRRALQALRALGGGHDNRQTAVGYQTAIVKMERLNHPPRGVVVGDRHWSVVKLGSWVQVGPVALRNGDGAEMIVGGSITI